MIIISHLICISFHDQFHNLLISASTSDQGILLRLAYGGSCRAQSVISAKRWNTLVLALVMVVDVAFESLTMEQRSIDYRGQLYF